MAATGGIALRVPIRSGAFSSAELVTPSRMCTSPTGAMPAKMFRELLSHSVRPAYTTPHAPQDVEVRTSEMALAARATRDWLPGHSVSDSGSNAGATASGQVRSDAV